MLGVGAGLAALAGVLGLKRKHDRRRDEKSDYSSAYTDASYSDYYTSESEFGLQLTAMNHANSFYRQCKL